MSKEREEDILAEDLLEEVEEKVEVDQSFEIQDDGKKKRAKKEKVKKEPKEKKLKETKPKNETEKKGKGFLGALITLLVIIIGSVSTYAFVPSVKNGINTTLNSTFNTTLGLVGKDNTDKVIGGKAPTFNASSYTPQRKEGTFKVHLFDTKGDAVILESDGDVALINSGEKEDVQAIKAKLNELGIKKVRYLIATHYHEEAIEGLLDVVNTVQVDFILLAENIDTTPLGASIIKTLDSKKLVWSYPKWNGVYPFGKTSIKFIKTHEKGSAIPYITNEKTTFLLSGTITRFDAENISKLPTSVSVYSINTESPVYSVNYTLLENIHAEQIIVSGNKANKVTEELKSKGYNAITVDTCSDYTIDSNGIDVVSACHDKK